MIHRSRIKLLSLVIGVLLLGGMVQAVLAESYYFRFVPPPPSLSCSLDGDVYMTVGSSIVEYNLPVGAQFNVHVWQNGVTMFSLSGIPAPSGYFKTPEDPLPLYMHGPSPYTVAYQIETVIDGQIVYTSTLTLTCNGESGKATITNSDDPVEGACPLLLDGSVVGALPNEQIAFYEPGKITVPNVVVNPGTYWVLGEDESGEYYKILLACQYLWVPVGSMQPSYQSPWSGQPLPTRVVD